MRAADTKASYGPSLRGALCWKGPRWQRRNRPVSGLDAAASGRPTSCGRTAEEAGIDTGLAKPPTQAGCRLGS